MNNPYADKQAIAEHDRYVARDVRGMAIEFTARLAPFVKDFEMSGGRKALLDLINQIDDACANTMGSIIVDCDCAIADAAVAKEEA